MIEATLKAILTSPDFLVVWGLLVAVSLAVVLYDLRSRNPQTPSLMKAVWLFTVLYSGPLGLAVYYYSGRKQIARDSLWRRSFRSVAHCYSGCGGGEIVGVFITAGLLSLSTWWVAGITFALAYAGGFALTVGPLMQEDVPLHQALWEVVAISVDIWLAGDATMAEPLFWASLAFSLSMGLLAAYPVNVLLIALGVKEGMHSPNETQSTK
jgi:hypothetical protein